MFRSKEEFLKTRRKKEEVKEITSEKVEKLADNIYFTNLIKNRKRIKELQEKSYKMQIELSDLKMKLKKLSKKSLIKSTCKTGPTL